MSTPTAELDQNVSHSLVSAGHLFLMIGRDGRLTFAGALLQS